MRLERVVCLALVALPSLLFGQDPNFANKRVPFEPGFRVYYIPDMEGMGSAVFTREIIAGTEGERYKNSTSTDYWNYYRQLLTKEVNATINGARFAGARSFVVNEGHGGNLFANIIPWELDQAAILIRGYPKPMIMSTAIDSTFGAVIMTGAHANAGSPGVMAHMYSFDKFAVDGHVLNEIGFNALVAGEYGVPVVMFSGDDVLVKETKEMIGQDRIGVVVKTAVGRSAAIAYSPQRVRKMLYDSSVVAIKRAMAGRYKPFVLPKPYTVEFSVRRSYPAEYIAGIDSLMTRYQFEKAKDRDYRMVTSSAKEIAYLLDAIERVVLR
jgi:D-amino peptidase